MSILVYKQRFRHPNKKDTPGANYAHVRYIATRPRVLKNEKMNHGLFGKLEPGAVTEFGDWKDVAKLSYANSKKGIVMYRRRENGYFYYTLQSAALPLYELKGMVPECQEMIVSEESLYATICTHYPAYRERYNALVAQEQQIPQIDAPANLFLQEQLDRGQTEADEETIHEEAFAEEEADEDEYGEQVDYGFGA